MSMEDREADVLAHIACLSSAEEIFTYLLLPFDQAVVNVSRLHIMKRFGTYLREADFDGQDQQQIFLACRRILKRAHGDFVTSTPHKEKVFKVFRDEEAKRKARFVGLDQLTLSVK
ncbi:nitrogenase stabilizing/protective protein NifW [Roseibacterium beibuensis]|uniref:Nitrogenase-stabilizing/protective protein NifW n=1 Tax=[Roseibacterium] beibuensis TaxID=1193142 RepID=A0ABP9LIM4_9RHOB|nr:nitrogenase stabilizing/protective protein NifW [Roseibacterium beibuensis]MCS6623556.1 nitrogenase stabilizing/protective protein NifW [Roseibacterium beibuensis]